MSASSPGSIRSTIVAMPFLVLPAASRACWLALWTVLRIRSCVDGSFTRAAASRACCAARSAACRALSKKLIVRPSCLAPCLCVLDDDPLDDVGHVLALVDRALEERVDLFPLDDLDRVLAVREQARDRATGELVALVLEAVHLDPVALQVLEAAQLQERLMPLLGLAHDDGRLLDRDLGRAVDAVQDERVGDF